VRLERVLEIYTTSQRKKMKVSIFVDGANFFYMQKDGLKWFADPKRIREYIEKTRGEVVDAIYYVGVQSPPEVKDEKYLKSLPYMGYSVIKKDIKTIYTLDGNIKQKANLDIEIVLDMFNTIDNYDMAVLISGDGDFHRALDLLKARGKRYLIMSTKQFIARELIDFAGMHYIDFQDIKAEVEKIQ
jgi:uncharacterized LabA/DUF88 family protein